MFEKKYFLLALLEVLLVSTISFAGNNQDSKCSKHRDSASGSGFATWKVDGCYVQGDAVVRDTTPSKKGNQLSGDAGPFFCISKDGCSDGVDPAVDTGVWFYCCSTPTPPTESPLVSGSAVNILLQDQAHSNNCVPMTGASDQLPSPTCRDTNALPNGNSGTLVTTQPLNGSYIFSATITPALPNDGSSLQIQPYNITQNYTPNNGSSICYIQPGTSTCQIYSGGNIINTTNDGSGNPWINGDITGIRFQYFPGTSSPTFTLNTVNWTITAMQ